MKTRIMLNGASFHLIYFVGGVKMSENWFSKPMKDEVPFSDIEKKFENGEFHSWNFEPLDFQENGYEDVISKIKEYAAPKYLELQDLRDSAKKVGDDAKAEEYQKKMDRMVDEVLAIYREKDIFPIQYFSEFGIIDEIERCIAYKAFWNGNVVSCGAGIGTTLCNYLFPNLFDTPSQHDLDKTNARSLYEKFHNDEYLKRAIKFCFSYKNGCPVPTSVMGGLRLVGSAPTNFRPMNAKAVYERFCPENGTIYDFCCVDDETEYFNGKKWVRMSDYNEGDKVLQYNEDGSANLVSPVEYIHYKSDDVFYEYIGKTFNTCLTGNHDVVYRKRINDTSELSESCYKIKQSEIVNKDFTGRIPLVCSIDGSITVEENLLRLAVAVQADGTIDDFNTGRVRVLFTKQRKIKRYKDLLDACRIPYRVSEATGKYTGGEYIYFNSKDIISIFKTKEKTFPEDWYNLSLESKLIFLDEVVHWDGHEDHDVQTNKGVKKDVYSYCTTNKENAELVYYLSNTSGGCGASMRIDARDGYKVCYYINFRTKSGYGAYRGHVNKYNIIRKRDKYCFVVPSHMLVLRRRNQMFITGNCGFGGRLLGALSSSKNFRYVGTDPNTETMYNLHRLADYIEQVTGREDSYELHCCGSEVFRGPANSVDFAFSSPPYFDLEVYSDEPTQCYNKFPKLEDWLEGYVRETIKNIVYMLKPGAVYAVNIADFTSGGSTVAYVDEWIRISGEEGAPLFDTVYLGVTARAGSKEQAAGELKKENILIFKKGIN